jgi:uncharacterized YccA/Bax inhibitor family protein
MYRSGNPALNDSTFEKSAYKEVSWWEDSESNLMSMNGVVDKTALLLTIVTLTAIAVYLTAPTFLFLTLLGGIVGFVVALIIIFSGSMNPTLICTYAACQGLFLGGITWIIERQVDYPGLGIVAAVLTLLILGVMLSIYRAGLISWNKNMQIAVTSSMVAILLIYLVSFIGSFVGFEIPLIHGNGIVGIGFSVFVVGIASLCLVADFDFIEKGVERGAPKQLEWRAAFGLLVTLIWLYLEILKLLAKLASRR